MNDEKRVIIYVREHDMFTVDEQTNTLREYCKRAGWKCAVIVDKGRVRFTQLLSEVRKQRRGYKRLCDIILVYNLTVWSHSPHKLFQTLGMLRDKKIRFIAYSPTMFDTGYEDNREYKYDMLGKLITYHAEVSKSKIRSGIIRAKAQGKQVGRQPLTDLKVGYLIERHNAGDSLREIARRYKQAFQQGVSIETIRKYIRQVKGGK